LSFRYKYNYEGCIVHNIFPRRGCIDLSVNFFCKYRGIKWNSNVYVFFFHNIIILHTWTVPYQGSACTDSLASEPTTDSRLRNRCNIRRPRPVIPRYHPVRTTICISAPTAPSTSSSSRDSTTGTPACTRICRLVYQPPRHRKEPSGNPKVRRAPHRNEQFPQTTLRDPLSMAVHRNMYTI